MVWERLMEKEVKTGGWQGHSFLDGPHIAINFKVFRHAPKIWTTCFSWGAADFRGKVMIQGLRKKSGYSLPEAVMTCLGISRS